MPKMSVYSSTPGCGPVPGKATRASQTPSGVGMSMVSMIIAASIVRGGTAGSARAGRRDTAGSADLVEQPEDGSGHGRGIAVLWSEHERGLLGRLVGIVHPGEAADLAR